MEKPCSISKGKVDISFYYDLAQLIRDLLQLYLIMPRLLLFPRGRDITRSDLRIPVKRLIEEPFIVDG